MSERPTRLWTLAQAREWLLPRALEGEHCPLCKQWVKIYEKRTVHSTIARALCLMHRAGGPEGTDWVHVPTVVSGSCELSKARFWGLVEE